MDRGACRTSCTNAFIKQEITFNRKMPRMISARQEELR